MRSARDQSPSLPIDVLGISLQRVPHVEAWRVGCHLSSPPRHSTGVPNDTVCMCVELVTNPSSLQILLSPDTGETKVSCPVQLVYLFRKNVQH
ncbi:hypothetical protein TNCV_3087231 [Trichonephila clavipes]|nr:hypothetical protein TNCV_3087231 [Trichonephila clavipes]